MVRQLNATFGVISIWDHGRNWDSRKWDHESGFAQLEAGAKEEMWPLLLRGKRVEIICMLPSSY